MVVEIYKRGFMEEKSVRGMRKILGQALVEACKVAEEMTGESINALPEYFLVVKSAEFVNDRLKTFTFSMEDRLSALCDEIGIRPADVSRECRIDGAARADLVLRSRRSKKVKHVVEFKRGMHKGQIEKDALRLAGLCAHAPAGHRMEKNFLVVVSSCGEKALENRGENIALWVEEKFPGVEVKFEPVKIGEHKSTRTKSEGKALRGGVWQFSYKG